VRHLEKVSPSEFAAEVSVRQPSVFSWIWLDKRVSQDNLPLVSKTVGASLEEWWMPIKESAALASINRMKARRRKGRAA